jgi:hypothetical protein
VAEPPDPWRHFAKAIEELLRAGADGLALLGEGPGLGALRGALRDERRRWELRAAGDPAAARVHDLIDALLSVLEAETDGTQSAPPHARRPPPRAPRKRGAGSR